MPWPGLVVRRLISNINRTHYKEERLKAARFVHNKVSALLTEGWVIGRKENLKTHFKNLPIGGALSVAFKIKKNSIREGIWKDYVSLLKNFKGLTYITFYTAMITKEGFLNAAK